MAPKKFTSFIAPLFCFRSTVESSPSSPSHESSTIENLQWSYCENHDETATGSCTCGLDTLQDGSLDFHKIDDNFRGFVSQCIDEESLKVMFGNEVVVGEFSEESERMRIGEGFLFSYDELSVATDSFHSSRKLGDGAYGCVYKGKLRDGQTVAVKEVYVNNNIEATQIFQELTLFCSLRHPNIVTLQGCNSGYPDFLLVYEYLPNGTVADHLHGRRKSACQVRGWALRIQIAIETAEALVYLHLFSDRQPIIHRDLKTENILLDEAFHAKVGDFGLSGFFGFAPGTQGYLDPEYQTSGKLTEKSDVYSFGVVLLELISGQEAVDVNRVNESSMDDVYLVHMALKKIRNNELEQLIDKDIEDLTDPNIKRMISKVAELACRCLKPEGGSRPSMAEVVKNLKSIRDDTCLLENDVPFLPSAQGTVDEDSPDAESLPYALKRCIPACLGLRSRWMRWTRCIRWTPTTQPLDGPARTSTHQFNAYLRGPQPEALLSEVTNILSLCRINCQESGAIKMIKHVRRSYGHKLSSIALFVVFKSSHEDHSAPWTCGCNLYIQNNIFEGLHQSASCFFSVTYGYIVLLATLADMPPHVFKPIYDQITSRVRRYRYDITATSTEQVED